MSYLKYLIPLCFILLGCNSSKLPTEKFGQYTLSPKTELTDDQLIVKIENPLHCPIRIWLNAEDEMLKTQVSDQLPFTLAPLEKWEYAFDYAEGNSTKIRVNSSLGSLHETVTTRDVEIPFPKGKEYKLVQGYNSTPTHNTDWARYALDFGLNIGDTITSATNGYVVGVVKDYKYGGEGRQWDPYSNFITIYDPENHLFTQYVHLVHQGSFVSVGDKVEKGQPIGLAGMTGNTNIEHLHFNTLKPFDNDKGLISIPLDSIGGQRIADWKRNQMIVNE